MREGLGHRSKRWLLLIKVFLSVGWHCDWSRGTCAGLQYRPSDILSLVRALIETKVIQL